jgi:hypothetical protein
MANQERNGTWKRTEPTTFLNELVLNRCKRRVVKKLKKSQGFGIGAPLAS